MTYDPMQYGMRKIGGAEPAPGAAQNSPASHEDLLFAPDPSFAPDPEIAAAGTAFDDSASAAGNLGALMQGLPDLDVAPPAAPAPAASAPAAPAERQPRRAPPSERQKPASRSAPPPAADARRPDRFGQRPASSYYPPTVSRRARPVVVAPLILLAGLTIGAWCWFGLASLPFGVLGVAAGVVGSLFSWVLLRS
jgi:hypothetical protein